MLKQRVITAAVLLICLLLVALLFNELAFFIFIACVSMLAAWEWAGLSGFTHKSARISYGLVFLGVLVFAEGLLLDALVPVLIFSICFWFLAFICILAYPDSARIWNRRLLLAVLGLIVIYPTSYALLYLYSSDYFAYRFLGLFLFVGAADTGAYFTGRSFGRHKLAESVSPNKTWEGVLGGFISCTLISLIYSYLFHHFTGEPFPLLFALSCPLLVSIFSVTGDLFESMLKRVRDMKDSGHILPGHGGILDRIDGVVAAAPVYLLSTVFFFNKRMSDVQKLQQVTILGSTGSIGLNTLKVIADNTSSYRVFALSANTKFELMFEQCQQFRPDFAVMVDPSAAKALQDLLSREGVSTRVLSGKKALLEIAAHEHCDIVMAAIVGGVGLMPTLKAAQAGKRVLLANKEALVMAGPLFMETVRQAGALLLPIDSEHNAIFQCLPIGAKARFEDKIEQGVDKIVLTASGGPFLDSKAEELARVTPAQACEHPNWRMGPKISVDSATLMNKALEFIEASILFNLEPDRIDVLVHAQSIVHSMVYYRDGSVLAQMGNPDMRTPIAHAMAWPYRIKSGVQTLDLKEISSLDFRAVDNDRFPAILLGQAAAKAGGTAPVILNAANEIAVAAFLANTLSFPQIPVIIERALNQQESRRADSIEEVLEADAKARELTRQLVSNCQ